MNLITFAACIAGLLAAPGTAHPATPHPARILATGARAPRLQTQVCPKEADLPIFPKGWSSTTDKKSGVVTMRLDGDDKSMIRVYPRALREGVRVDQWLRGWALSREAPVGKFTKLPEVVSATLNTALGNQTFRNKDGKEGLTFYVAVSVDGLMVRPMDLVLLPGSSSRKPSVVFQALTKQLLVIEKAAAKREGRGLKLEATPPKVKGIRSGGPIEPGRYVGNRTYKGKARGVVEVQLHANGEYEIVQGFSRFPTGQYVYSQATGRMNISNDLRNGTYDPREDFCIYGQEEGGGPIIYAENDSGFAADIYRLRRQGPVTRRPASEVARIEAEIEAEAKRYKWVTEPGEGVQLDQIEAVVATARSKIISGSYNMDEDVFLLMKDGRVMHGMPVPPSDLHVAFSRSKEPDRWGHWKKIEGQYRFAWPADPDKFEAPPGVQTVGAPFANGTRIDGSFSAASSTSTLNGGSASFWGLVLGPEGHFKKWRNGIAGYGDTPGLSDVMTSVYVGYNDDGSTVSVNGNGIGGVTTSKNGTSLRDRSGRYALLGYAATLSYGNGKIERVPCFYTSDSRRAIWFGSGSLRLDDQPEGK